MPRHLKGYWSKGALASGFLVLVILLASSHAQDEEEAILRGVVLPLDRSDRGGFRVRVVGLPGVETTSNENGRFAIRGVPPGRHLVIARRAEDGAWGQAVSEWAADGFDEMRLTTLPGKARVEGRVLLDGEPVEGAVVHLDLERVLVEEPGGQPRIATGGGGSALTDEEGRFPAFRACLPGDYELTVEGEGGLRCDPVPARVEQADDVLDLTVEAERGATLAGRVVDAEGRPLRGIGVSVRRSRAEYAEERTDTGDDGRFRFEGLDPDPRYTVQVYDGLDRFRDANQRDLSLPAEDLEIALDRTGAAYVRVVQPDGSGAVVEMVELFRCGPSGRAGHWSRRNLSGPRAPHAFPDLPDGRYWARAVADGRLRGRSEPFEVQAGSPAWVTIVCRPLPHIAPVEEQADVLFHWFESLGYPHVQGLPYVRVWTDAYFSTGDGRVEHTLDGFLVEDAGDRFTVVHELEMATYERSEETTENGGPRYEVLELAEVIDGLVEGLDADRTEALDIFRGLTPGASRRLHLFLMARAAHANDLEERVLTLLRLVDEARGGGARPDRGTLVDKVRRDLAHVFMGEALRRLRVPEITRPELRDGFRRIVQEFPSSEYVRRAEALAALLDVMIAEDERHTAPPRPLAELPVEQQVEELIYRLREQSRSLRYPTVTEPPDGETPAHRLVDLGWAAIPRLLQILHDDRLTLVLDAPHHMTPLQRSRIVRYSDMAREILRHITGRTFRSREAAEAWWEEAGERDPFELCLRALEEAERARVWYAARALIDRDRSRGVRAVVEATESAPRGRRRNLVAALISVGGEEAVPFLVEEVRNGPDPCCRWRAVRGLARRGNEAWIEPVVDELEAGIGDPGLLPGATEEDRDRLRAEEEGIRLLGRQGGREGLDALRRLYPSLRPRQRRLVIRTVAGRRTEVSNLRDLADAILVEALDDEGDTSRDDEGSGTGRVDRDRPCDEAASSLARRWGLEEPYPEEGTEAERVAYRQRLREMAAERRGE